MQLGRPLRRAGRIHEYRIYSRWNGNVGSLSEAIEERGADPIITHGRWRAGNASAEGGAPGGAILASLAIFRWLALRQGLSHHRGSPRLHPEAVEVGLAPHRLPIQVRRALKRVGHPQQACSAALRGQFRWLRSRRADDGHSLAERRLEDLASSRIVLSYQRVGRAHLPLVPLVGRFGVGNSWRAPR